MALFIHSVQEARKIQKSFAMLSKKHLESEDFEIAKGMDLAALAIKDWIKAQTGFKSGDMVVFKEGPDTKVMTISNIGKDGSVYDQSWRLLNHTKLRLANENEQETGVRDGS